MSNYDSDDAYPRSPGLKPVKPKATPSPSPPPFIPQRCAVPTSPPVNHRDTRRLKQQARQKTRPSQGDTVLLGFMAPDRPDIAQLAGQQALNSESASEESDEEMEAEEPVKPAVQPQQAGAEQLKDTARQALAVAPPKDPTSNHRDSVVEAQLDSHPRSIVTPTNTLSSTLANGIPVNGNGLDSKSPISVAAKVEASSPNLTSEPPGSLANGYSRDHKDPLTVSPKLRELAIPQRKGSPSQKLPALQNPNSPSRDGPAGSPNQERRLPSFRHLSELAETAINEQNESRSNGFPHRQSISSTGQSPPLGTRQYSISSQLSPATGLPPLSSATSPLSANSEFSTQDPFLRSGQHSALFGSSTRRPSQASENGPPYMGGLPPSSAVTDGYQSSDTLSPGSNPTPIDRRHRMSLDGALTNRTLPLPTGTHIQHIPPHGSGGFKCDHPGCTAAPFQTQYLLK